MAHVAPHLPHWLASWCEQRATSCALPFTRSSHAQVNNFSLVHGHSTSSVRPDTVGWLQRIRYNWTTDLATLQRQAHVKLEQGATLSPRETVLDMLHKCPKRKMVKNAGLLSSSARQREHL